MPNTNPNTPKHNKTPVGDKMKLLGKASKKEINKYNSSSICKLPANHPDIIEVWDDGFVLQSQTGHIISHEPDTAIAIFNGEPVWHYIGNGETAKISFPALPICK